MYAGPFQGSTATVKTTLAYVAAAAVGAVHLQSAACRQAVSTKLVTELAGIGCPRRELLADACCCWHPAKCADEAPSS
jgi:predicted kinase